jgi:outer membrane protein
MRRVVIISSLMMSGCAWAALPVPAVSSASLPQPGVSRDWNAPPIYPIRKVTGDPVGAYAAQRSSEARSDANASLGYEPVYSAKMSAYKLPAPMPQPGAPRTLSLRDAIALALRGNPQIKISELQRVLDKFGLELIAQTYRLQWNPLALSATLQNKVDPVWNATGGFQFTNTPIGTQFSLTQTNNMLGGPGTTNFSFTQPLLKGFGFAVNRVNYQNGIDNERIARVTFKNSVITTVVQVITAYRTLVGAYNALALSKQSLKNQEESARQTQLRVKAGQMAAADLMQQQTNVESTRLSVVQSENALRNAYQSFLSALGLVPSADILIDQAISIDHVKVPPLTTCVKNGLKGNLQYQTALIQLNITQRALITAKDARKWTLNLTSTAAVGAQRSAMGQPITSTDVNPNLGFSLSIPIDNIQAKQGEESAKIAIEDAKINLEQQKEQLVRTVIDQWEAIKNQRQQVSIAELAVKLQQKTLDNAYLKLKYGKSSVFETNTLESSLLSQQTNLVGEKITYLNDATALYQTMGLTLDMWKIKLTY